jgi:pimeloyl-ACP methyl ester carboxylesterase
MTKPILLVHSSGLSSRQWVRLLKKLPSARAVDLPGYAGTPGTDLAGDLDFLVGELDALGAAHVVGHSYGGFLALKLALARPKQVLSLALYEPVAFGVLRSTHDTAGLADLGRFLVDPALGLVGGSEAWLERFVDYWQGKGAWAGLPEPTRQAFLAVGDKVFREVSGISADLTPHTAYEGLRIPTLLLGGERSPVAAQRVLAVLEATLPDATRQVIAGAGHMGPISHGEAVNPLLVAHLYG